MSLTFGNSSHCRHIDQVAGRLLLRRPRARRPPARVRGGGGGGGGGGEGGPLLDVRRGGARAPGLALHTVPGH